MRQVEQAVVSDVDGDCFRACVASLLEMGCAEVPNFHGADWWDNWQEWLRPRGFYLLSWPYHNAMTYIHGYYIAHVDSPRFSDKLHAVIMKDGVVVWDPSPHRGDGTGPVKQITVFVSLDPCEHRQ